MILQEKNPRPSAGRWALVAAVMVLITLPGWTQSPPPRLEDKAVPAAPAVNPLDPMVATPPRSSDVPVARAPASSSHDQMKTASRSSDKPAPAIPGSKPSVPPTEAPTSKVVLPSSGGAHDAPGLLVPGGAETASALAKPTSNTFNAKTPESRFSPAEPSSRTLSTSERQMSTQFWMGVSLRARQFRDVSARATTWVEQRDLNGETETRLVLATMDWFSGAANGDFKRDRIWTYLPPLKDDASAGWMPVHLLSYKQGEDLISHQEFVESGAWLNPEISPREPFMEEGGMSGMDLALGHPRYIFPGLWNGASFPAQGLGTQDIVMITVDGLQTMKQTWNFFSTSPSQPSMLMTVWSAPKYGHAPVRVEYQKLTRSGRPSLTTRIRYRDFVTKEGLSYATRIEAIRDEFQDDGTLHSRVRMRSVVDEVKINGGVSASAFRPSPRNPSFDFDEEGDGPSRTPLAKLSSPSMRYKFEKPTEQQIQAYRKAVGSGPFGPPTYQSSIAVSWRVAGADEVAAADPSALPPPSQEASVVNSVTAPAVDPSALPSSTLQPSISPNAPNGVAVPVAVVTSAPASLPPASSGSVPELPGLEPATSSVPNSEYGEPDLAPAAPPVNPSPTTTQKPHAAAAEPVLSAEAVEPVAGMARDAMVDDLARPTPAARVSLAELKDEIELMKVRLEGKRAEVDVATARMKAKAALVDNLKVILEKDRNAVSHSDMFKAEFELQESRAQFEQARAGYIEAQLRITLANRRFDRELRRDKRELEAAVQDYKHWEASQKEPMMRRASERIWRLRQQLEEVEEAASTPPVVKPDQPLLEAANVQLRQALDEITKRRDLLKRTIRNPEDPELKALGEEERQLRTRLEVLQKEMNQNPKR